MGAEATIGSDLPAAAGIRDAPRSGDSLVPLRTLARPVRWEGVGIHSGRVVNVTAHPSALPGIVFLSDGIVIPAVAEFVTDTGRCTVLSRSGVSIATVEHLLAALTGLGIWSAKIEVDGPELPILDGSAAPFVDRLLDAGSTQIGEWEAIEPKAGRVDEGDAFREWSAGPSRRSFVLSGDHPLLSGLSGVLERGDPGTFSREIAPCRTWAPIEQVQPLLDCGLIRGGSLDNALVVYPDRYSSELRRENEPAGHKLLDLIGDLALAGRPVRATIAAVGGGHTLNVRMARAIRTDHRAASGRRYGSGDPEAVDETIPGGYEC